MTSEEARAIAERTAHELNLPWDSLHVEVGRPPLIGRRFGCRVRSTSALPGGTVTTTLMVNTRKGTAEPIGVRYLRSERERDYTFFAGQLSIGILVGGLTFIGARRFGGVSTVWSAIGAVAIGLVAMVYTIKWRRLP